MTADDIRRRARRELQEVVSVETADYLLERPPGGWDSLVTKDDLATLEQRFHARFAAIDARFAAIDERFSALEARFDERFSALEERFDWKLSSKIDQAFAAQTWRLVAAMTALGGVIVAAIKL